MPAGGNGCPEASGWKTGYVNLSLSHPDPTVRHYWSEQIKLLGKFYNILVIVKYSVLFVKEHI